MMPAITTKRIVFRLLSCGGMEFRNPGRRWRTSRRGLWRRSRGREPCKRRFHIVKQTVPGTVRRAHAGDEDIVTAGDRQQGRHAARAASLRRRLARLRMTALPTLRVAVKPSRTVETPSWRSSRWTTTAPRASETPFAAARNWGREVMRSILKGSLMRPNPGAGRSGRQALAALGATPRNNLLTVLGGHPRTEAVSALAHESRRLIGPLHVRLLGLKTKKAAEGVRRGKGGRISGRAHGVNADGPSAERQWTGSNAFCP
jgi:hypothetical protein